MDPDIFKRSFKTTKPKKIGSDKKMGIAYHEAGHALIDFLYGFIPKEITITPDKNKKTLGHVSNIWEDNDCYDFTQYLNDIEKEMTTDEQLEYLAVSLMAGIIAESFYSGSYNWHGAENDLNSIIKHFVSYQILDLPNLQPYWDKTYNLIKTNLEQLKTIANDLYKYETLKAEYFTKYKNHGKN